VKQTLALFTMLLVLFLNACAPAQPPTARAPTSLETQLFTTSDLSPLNNDFTEGIGNLTWLDSEGIVSSVTDSWLMAQHTNRTPVWYSDTSGAMLYTYISGDFLVETKVTSNLRSDMTQQSDSRYTSAGLIVRDPASSSGKMRWMVFNIGYQDGYFGTEIKTTRDSTGGFSLEAFTGNTSLSTWFSNKLEGPSNEAHLRICRIGAELRFYLLQTGQTTWYEEELTTKTQRAGSEAPVPGLGDSGPMRFQRADLPAMLQVGLISNDINTAGTSESRFDYFRVQRISNFESCNL
jgi:hypothetical protein